MAVNFVISIQIIRDKFLDMYMESANDVLVKITKDSLMF